MRVQFIVRNEQKSYSNQRVGSVGRSSPPGIDIDLHFRLKRIIGNCYKISEEIRGLFFRMMLVYHPVALLAMDDLDQNAFTLL